MFFQNSLILHFLYFVLDDLNSPLIGVLLGINYPPCHPVGISGVFKLTFKSFGTSQALESKDEMPVKVEVYLKLERASFVKF